MNGKFRRIRGLGEYCPDCKHANALAVWGTVNGATVTVLACDFCRYEEREDDSAYMGSDSDFSDHALGIDY